MTRGREDNLGEFQREFDAALDGFGALQARLASGEIATEEQRHEFERLAALARVGDVYVRALLEKEGSG